MADGPVSIEMRHGVSALLATCGVALMAVSAVNASTFTPGASLLFLGILGFIANRVGYELTERPVDEEDTTLDSVLILGMVALMIAAAAIVFFLFRPFLPI